MANHWFKHNLVALLTVSILLLIAFFFHNNTFKKLPFGYHVWSKSDHLALTYGFYENQLDFFHPETSVITQNDSLIQVTHPGTSITATDLPIHSYIPAVAMKLMGSKTPLFHRLYLFLISFLGLFYLYKLGFILTDSQLKSVLLTVFGFVTPVFLFYQASFLPSIGAWALAVIGVYFYFSHLKGKNHHLILALFWLTLAALSRTTFVIPLFAVFGNEIMNILAKRTSNRTLVSIGISFFTLLSYTLYKSYLKSTYGSIFLGELLPPSSLGEAKEILKYMFEQWKWTYLSIGQWIVLIIAFGSFLFVGRLKASDKWFFLFFLLGEIAFFYFMMVQFRHHDYYFLDSFFLLVILLFGYFITSLPIATTLFKSILLFVIACLLLEVYHTYLMKQERVEIAKNDLYHKTLRNFTHAKALLKEHQVAKNDKILMLGAYGTNISFLQIDQKGYFTPKMSREKIEEYINLPFDYMLLQKEFFVQDVYGNYPEILSKIDKLAENDQLILAKRTLDTNKVESLNDFLGIKQNQMIYNASLVPINSANWNNLLFNEKDSSYSISDSMLYGPAHDLLLEDNQFDRFLSVRILAEVKQASEVGANIIFGVSSEEQSNVVYENIDLNDFVNEKNKWQEVDVLLLIPAIDGSNRKAICYFYNPNGIHLSVKNVNIEVY